MPAPISTSTATPGSTAAAATERSASWLPSMRLMANALRALAIDAVEAANSGHPGLPLGAADIAAVLFARHLKFDASAPRWPDRDRFVLSAGHGSMLLYALLHLAGHEDMALDDIKAFRKLGSRAAGHPEFGLAAGIETTTGPLGQGLATAVGMAMAERHLAARFGAGIVDHRTYVLASDGDLMEGISHEAIALAGHLRLSRLIVLFDDNGISIDGPLSLAESGDQVARFKAAGWSTVSIDGHDLDAIDAALTAARDSDRPSFIACRTVIGYGAPNKQGSAGVHGSPLGADELAATKAALDWPHGPFEVPAAIREAWLEAGARGRGGRRAWEERLSALETDRRAEFDRRQRGALCEGLADAVAALKRQYAQAPLEVATRKASELALDAINAAVEETVGGSADLSGSNNTRSKDMRAMAAEDFSGRYVHYGVREHAMAAAMNGMALHGGVIPYGGTFLIFSDYCRPAMRLSALMGQRVIYVMTHDSIGLGEDGPTHQPVEHLAALRAIPNLAVFRPADTVETAECWELALRRAEGPSVLALSRQNLPQLRRDGPDRLAENVCARGGYVLEQASGDAQVTLIATGSEVHIALAARALLEAEGTPAAVVSMPCCELFDAQPQAYRDAVLGTGVKVAIEAASPMPWYRYVGDAGAVVGLTGFGDSAPYQDLYRHFGLTAEALAATARERLLAVDRSRNGTGNVHSS